METNKETAQKAEAAGQSAATAKGGEAPRKFLKTQKDAVRHLKDIGYKTSTSQFNRDFKAGRIPRRDDGFEVGDLALYASKHLDTAKRAVDRERVEVELDKDQAAAELKYIQAQRQRLKLEQERGLLISRESHEDELAARAFVFRNEIEKWGARLALRVISCVEGKDERMDDFLKLWREETADWLDAWDTDREFGLEQDEDIDVMGDVHTAREEE